MGSRVLSALFRLLCTGLPEQGLNFAKLIDDNIGSGAKQVGLSETRGQCDGEAWDFFCCRNPIEGVFYDPAVGRRHFHLRDRLLKDFRRRFRVNNGTDVDGDFEEWGHSERRKGAFAVLRGCRGGNTKSIFPIGPVHKVDGARNRSQVALP